MRFGGLLFFFRLNCGSYLFTERPILLYRHERIQRYPEKFLTNPLRLFLRFGADTEQAYAAITQWYIMHRLFEIEAGVGPLVIAAFLKSSVTSGGAILSAYSAASSGGVP